jgi:hypothetical protein
MSHVAHELHEIFPEFSDQIHELKQSDQHFHRFFEAYHELNREIHRAEAEVETLGDEALETLKKKRLKLLDQIQAMLAAHRKSA